MLGQEAELVWHKDTSLGGADVVILPGGFAHGDYLRTGAIARFSPIMAEVTAFAAAGGPVLGICNGFQVLLEAGLLEGAMLRNREPALPLRARARAGRADATRRSRSPAGTVRCCGFPIAHGEGNYYAPPDVVAALEANRQVIFRYVTPRGRGDRRGEPERLAPQHRRHLQRARATSSA